MQGAKWKQLGLELPASPRKPKRGRPRKATAGVRHQPRELHPRCPLHVTLKVRRHVWQLRSRRCGNVVRKALLLGHARARGRIAHFSIQHDHIHLIVEAEDPRALATLIQGLAIRIARGLNKVMGARGRVFVERFHSRLLRTPTEVRTTLVYVLQNGRKHLRQIGYQLTASWTDDDYSSSPWFTGWLTTRPQPPPGDKLVADARTWLLARGWVERGGGAIRRDELPRS